MDTHARALLGLAALPSFGPVRIAALLERFSSVEKLWGATADEFRRHDVVPQVTEKFLRERAAVALPSLIMRCERAHVVVLGKEDASYPGLLREVADAPICVFVRGTVHAMKLMIAVVGTRRMTIYGRRVTHELAAGLARAGAGVVSGLALGIDAIAHEAALQQHGYTIAVLACGLDHIFPASNTGLAHAIVRHGGALLSEFPPGTPPLRHHFPIRNRIIAGMTSGTLVTEAPPRSGALLTAALALGYHRDVFAVPGPITSPTSRGTNQLLQDGATLVESADDIIRSYHISLPAQKMESNHLTNEERMVFAALADTPLTVDQIHNRCTLNASVINATLICLQLKGCVTQIDPLHFARTR